MKRAPWCVGWSKDHRRFYFRTPGGYSMTLSGRKAGIADHARDLLPKMLAVAERATDEDGNPEFITAIKDAILDLGVRVADPTIEQEAS